MDRREPGFCSGNHIEVSEERVEARAWLDFDLTKGLLRGELAPPEGAPLRKLGVGRWGASNRTKEEVTRPWYIKLQLRAIHEKEPLSDSRRSGGDGKHAVPVLKEQCAQRVIKDFSTLHGAATCSSISSTRNDSVPRGNNPKTDSKGAPTY